MSRTATVISLSTLIDFSTRAVAEASKYIQSSSTVTGETQSILLETAQTRLELADTSAFSDKILRCRTAFNLAKLAMDEGKPYASDSKNPTNEEAMKLAEWQASRAVLLSWEKTVNHQVSKPL